MVPATNNDEDKLLAMLSDICDGIENRNFKIIENIINEFHKDLSRNKDLLAALYGSGRKCITQTDLIISACVHKQADVLYYLLNETDILVYLTDARLNIQEVDKKRTVALRYAICSDNFSMVEALYDYWCGDQHWSGHDINNIERIGRLLANARHDCKQYLIQNVPMLIDVHCLIKFNDFQCAIYSDLSKTKLSSRNNKVKLMGTMILSLLRHYDVYSNLDRVRLALPPEREHKIMAELVDKSAIYRKSHTYIMYEVYFRKLDFNVALLILDNLNALRWHLKTRFNQFGEVFNKLPKVLSSYDYAAKLYDEIECTVYHFIYRSCDDWRLYLPRNRKLTVKKNRVGIHDGQVITNMTVGYDEEKIYNGSVLYLERKNFKKSLKKLKKILRKHVITKIPGIIDEIVKEINEDFQNDKIKKLPPLEKLLDNNYLKKTIYMSDYYSLRKIVNYLKSVENVNGIHILMIERALQVIGEMLKSTKDSSHLSKTTKALLQTALSIETVSHTHSLREYLSHVDKGELKTRINVNNNHLQTYSKIKDDLKKIMEYICPILDMYKYILDQSLLEQGISLLDKKIEALPDEAKRHKDEIYERFKKQGKAHEPQFIQEIWIHTGLSEQLLREIPWILDNIKRLRSKKEYIFKSIHDNLAINILPKCIENIKRTLDLITIHNSNVTMINDQIRKKNIKPIVPDFPEKKEITIICGKLKKNMKKNVDNNLLKMINDLKVNVKYHWNSVLTFINVLDTMKFRTLSNINFSVVNGNSLPDIQTINDVRYLIKEIETSCNIQIPANYVPYAFDGIKELDENIFIKDKNGPDTLIWCVISRIDELRKTLDYPKCTLSQLLLRYKRDEKFRIEVEMLLVDIANILAQCKICKMNKSAKLLTGIDMGNVLDHGNPFIEVIGDTIDPQDFPTELLSKALMFAEDRDTIAEIHNLYTQNTCKDRETIKLSYKGGNLEKFLEYLKLIPYKQ